MKICALLMCLLGVIGLAQQTAPAQDTPLTAAEYQYFRSLLMAASGVDSNESLVAGKREAIAKHLGLDEGEQAILSNTASQFKIQMQSLVTQQKAISTGDGTLTPSSRAALSKIEEQRDEAVRTQAAALLRGFRPKTISQIRAYCASVAHIIAK